MIKVLAMARKLLHNLHIEYKPRNKDASAWFIMEKEYIQVPVYSFNWFSIKMRLVPVTATSI